MTPTLAYYVGASASGTASATAPTTAGTYTVVASFAGGAGFVSATSSPVTFTIAQATPAVTVTGAGGTFDGQPIPATAKVAGVVAGVDAIPATSLEGVSPTLAYYVGANASGPASATAPTTAGTYTVVASFAGSTDYLNAIGSPITFTIHQLTPTVSVSEIGGRLTGQPFPATAKMQGIYGQFTQPWGNRSNSEPTVRGTPRAARRWPGAPAMTGIYAVVASFAGSTDSAAPAVALSLSPLSLRRSSRASNNPPLHSRRRPDSFSVTAADTRIRSSPSMDRFRAA